MNKIDLIIDALEMAADKVESAYVAIHIDEALAAARELKALKPVAWISESPTRGNGTRLFFTENEAYHYASKYEPLYALDEVTA